MNKITLLGTGTCQIQANRMASSVLIELGGMNIVYDIGRGITQRLLDIGKKQDQIEHIIISHFHTDHISDLPAFIHAGLWSKLDPRTKSLNIYGPKGIKKFVETIILGGMVNSFKSVDNFDIQVHEPDSGLFKIDNKEFETQILQPANNHAIKFSCGKKKIGITGDFDFSAEIMSFFDDLDIAVIDSGHNDIDQIVEIAVKSNTRQVYCTHLYDELDEEKVNQKALEQGYEGEIIIGKDLMEINLE